MSEKQSNSSKPQDLPKRLKSLAKDAGKEVAKESADIVKGTISELVKILTFQK